ncbi:MAG: DUF4003 family protein [Clostridium sp.]|uniref:DUF4003 family protein n=1 Tax=Clostridium sp. TaxID=1506 RepID=UPI003EE5780D
MINNKFINLFLDNMFMLDDIYGFVSHNTTIKFSALIATLKNITLSPSNIKENLHSIKISFDEDSPFRKEHTLILATLLTINPSISLKDVNSTFNELELAFSSNTFLAVSSEVLHFYYKNSTCINLIDTLKYTYNNFKERHWFIIGPEDISICSLFVSRFQDTLQKVNETENCYKYLEEIKYFPSNHVQSLSEALIFSNLPISNRCLRTVKLQQLFEQKNYIIRNEALPILGFASIVTDDPEKFTQSFISTITLLNKNTRFTTYKLNDTTKYIISLTLTILKFTNDINILDPLAIFLLNICTHETNSLTENIANKFFTD